MSIFDNLKNKVQAGVQNAIGSKTETYTFAALPESVDQLKALPEAGLDSPYKTAALTVCALCAYAAAPEIGIEMLDWLKGPQPLSVYDKQFLRDRFKGKLYLPFSYFAGATPDNDYTPSEPFTISISSNPHSFEQDGYATLYIPSGGADSPRPIRMRKKGDQWFMWEQFLMPDIRVPKSANPWA